MEKGTIVKLMQEFNVHLYKLKDNEKVLEKKRIAFVTDYNAINIKCLTKESYCTGLEKTTFCYRIENELRELGDMHGTNASKFGLYYGKWGEDETKRYRAVSRFDKDPDIAMEEIKNEIVKLLKAANKEDEEEILKCKLSQIFKLKILGTYYPDKYMNIYSEEHLNYFLKTLEITYDVRINILKKQQLLIRWMNRQLEAESWTLITFEKFLYEKIGKPVETNKKVKCQMKIIETENLHKCDLINFSELFEEIKACRWKEDLVNTYARYGIKDDTKKTGPTDNIDKSGKSKDLYASFRTPDNKRTATHILFEVNKIRVNTNDSIAFSSYFSNYEIHDNTNDGSYRNKYFNIAYDVDEFKYVMAYFLKYDLNWLDREYKEIEAVNKVDFQESVISEQNKIVQKHLNNIASIIEKEIEQVPVYGEEKKALTKIRINQSVFRELLLKRYSSCCLCNVNDKNFLVASHIKPWAKSNSEEKLDVNNGLLLCPNHDRLFDKGYISFDNDGRILISNNLSHNNLIYMNIRENMKINITDEAKKYMKYHRENIFID